MSISEKIAVLDFGSQYAHLLANRIRRLGVYAEILPTTTRASILKNYKGIILSGGPQSVYDKGAPSLDPAALRLGIPVLGVCYGHQLLAYILGGKVTPGYVKEYGLAELHVKNHRSLFKGLQARETVWMSHGDAVSILPKGASIIGSTKDCKATAVDFGKNIFGVQFHGEVTHTPHGMQVLKNFVALCKIKEKWNIATFLDEKIAAIKKEAKNARVFLLISGGVDSTVAFALLQKALGVDRVFGLFVDTGFLRQNEVWDVYHALKKIGVKHLHVAHAAKEFFTQIKGVTDPEQKRAIIGAHFLKVQAAVARKLQLNQKEWLLGQGTIYPDTIESGGTTHADKIKTHHNRIPEIVALMEQGKVIEPLKELYKDEVRMIGEKLGLPKQMVWRHPFPGPGLAVRCLCALKPDVVKNSSMEEKGINGFLKKLRCTGRILPLRSVGVQGDARSYRHPLLLSKILPWKTIRTLSPALTNRFSIINRVLVPVTDTSATPGVKKSTLTPRRIALLQKVDAIVQKSVRNTPWQKKIWQFPVVLLPLSWSSEKKGETVVLRPVTSTEAMTANATMLPWSFVQKIAKKIMRVPGVDAVLFDVTNKPPGTIEWE